MNLGSFGGDNRDHGKGFILDGLKKVSHCLHVDAMITDQPWPHSRSEEMLKWYRSFLRLADDHVLDNDSIRYQGGTKIPRDGTLQDYFLPHYDKDYDLFLDPNDGIHADGGSKDVTPKVVRRLLHEGSNRIIMVYITPTRDNRPGHALKDRFVRWFNGTTAGFFCWLAGNGILFLSRPENVRLQVFKQAVTDALGPYALLRIRDMDQAAD
jgi:hypothetical protein